MAVYSQQLRDAHQEAQSLLLTLADVLLAHEPNRPRPHVLRLRSVPLPGKVSAYSFETEEQMLEMLNCLIADAKGLPVTYPELTVYTVTAPIIPPPRTRRKKADVAAVPAEAPQSESGLESQPEVVANA